MANEVYQKLTLPNTNAMRTLLLRCFTNGSGAPAADSPNLIKNIAEATAFGYAFDFNTLTPMPNDIRSTTSGSISFDGLMLMEKLAECPDASIAEALSDDVHTFKRLRESIVSAGILSGDEMNAFSESIVQARLEEERLNPQQMSFTRQVVEKVRPQFPVNLMETSVQSFIEQLKTVGDKAVMEGIKQVENLRKHGHHDWEGWAAANWGTKWNAQHSSLSFSEDGSALELQFQTAWSEPAPVMTEFLMRAIQAAETNTIRYETLEEFHRFAYRTEISTINGTAPLENIKRHKVAFAADDECAELYASIYGESKKEWLEKLQSWCQEGLESLPTDDSILAYDLCHEPSPAP